MKQMKNNKSQGSDGYTADFDTFFWKDIKHFAVRAINCTFENKELPVSQRLILYRACLKAISLDNI